MHESESPNPQPDQSDVSSPPTLLPARLQNPPLRPQTPQVREPVTGATYFLNMRAFTLHCRRDPSVTAAAQLVYRVLLDEANRSYWPDSFICSLDDIESITHLARQTIIDARMRLKTKGFIDFHGNPSRYTIYSLVDYGLDRRLDRRATPHTPQGNTMKTNKKTKKESVKKERTDRNDHSTPAARPAHLGTPLSKEQLEHLRRVKARCKRHS